MADLFIPSQSETTVDENQIWRWFNNIALEFEGSYFTTPEKEFVLKYYKNAGLLKWWRKSFFRHHFSRNLTQAVNHLFSGKRSPRILDLGCGIGTQSLLYATLGAEVISLDVNGQALEILEKRQQLYQQACDRDLSIQSYCANALEFDYDRIAPLDGVYSMFAFNLMKPAVELLRKLSIAVGEGGRIAIIDGNRTTWINRILPSRRVQTLSPIELSQQLGELGFSVTQHRGGCALPPLSWTFIPGVVLRPIDSLLTTTWFFSVSHQILAIKK